MSSTFFRFVLGCSLMLCLALPGTAWAAGESADATVDVAQQVPMAQADSTFESEAGIPVGALVDETFMYMRGRGTVLGVILNYALTGAAIGALIGLGGVLIDDWNAWNIAYYSAGGAVVGGVVGGVVALLTERPVAASSGEWVKQAMPKTYQLRVLDLSF